ncbi:hypothetical protein ACFOLJ_11000 [Rugamonas sp. CCM 8940]|uniref:hypothetical protein n=1 Tax=Rugamonas sp. CCM 8940 TaxID=2765359 RepID=UPI0018F6EAA3|nr:hypothetical protein [Rugamonas sp. CCM 8940]MBJ7309723.1 hypothetical protein [Rugamonas sp. CCM 8940]
MKKLFFQFASFLNVVHEPEETMAGLHGNTQGVGRDIVDYLTAVATHFTLTINVTSGYRGASDQAQAMLKYWLKLKRGKVYGKKDLPEVERKKLDAYFKTCKADPKAKLTERQEARRSFLKLAGEQLGNKSRHCSGRAVDVTQASVPAAAYRAITLKLKEVREGRGDIYHFESVATVPSVSADDKKSWDALSTSPLASSGSGGSTLVATAGDFPCTCTA